MDIVAESLSANILKARNVTVRGQDVLKWFESKLSASVSFVGVFDDLADAPRRNGAVAIVGSKDYVFSSRDDKWYEFGDEGQIGVLTQAVGALSAGLSSYALSADVYSRTETSSAQEISAALEGKQPSGDYLSAEVDPVFSSLSGSFAVRRDLSSYALSADVYAKSQTSSATELAGAFSAVSSEYQLSAEAGSMAYESKGNYLSAVPAVYKTYDATVSSLSGSGYALNAGVYGKAETSSAQEISAALEGKQPSGDYLSAEVDPVFQTALSGRTYSRGMTFENAVLAICDIISAMGGTITD